MHDQHAQHQFVGATCICLTGNPKARSKGISGGVGLVDDDFGMELLVGGAIISLSLPVRLVWECVWRPTLPSAGSETSGECHNHL